MGTQSVRGALHVSEETDIEAGAWTGFDRTEREAIDAQVKKSSSPTELFEELLNLCDARPVDFLSFNVKAKDINHIHHNCNGFRYTLSPEFVAYLDGRGRDDKQLDEIDKANDQRDAEWVAAIKEAQGDLLDAAMCMLWKRKPKLAHCIHRHCYRRIDLKTIASEVNLKTEGAVSKRIGKGLRIMRGWVIGELARSYHAGGYARRTEA